MKNRICLVLAILVLLNACCFVSAYAEESAAAPADGNTEDEYLYAYQQFLRSGNHPEECRYAIYDIDGDGLPELFYLFDSAEEATSAEPGSDICGGFRYDPSANGFIRLRHTYGDFSSYTYCLCQVTRDGKPYSAAYCCSPSNQIDWLFSPPDNSAPADSDYLFLYSNFGGDGMEQVPDTFLYRSTAGASYTEPAFTLNDGEFYTLFQNCVRVIGAGPEFAGRDLSMSYDEVLALESMSDAPRPGRPSQSSVNLAAGTDEKFLNWKDAYRALIRHWGSKYQFYYIYDLDKDGIPEIILDRGFPEAGRTGMLYRFSDGNAVFVGEFSMSHCLFETYPAGNGILKIWGHMGGRAGYLMTMENGLLSETELYNYPDGYEGEIPTFPSSVRIPEISTGDPDFLLQFPDETW